eukprot:TRINITY_DN9160_c0_g2_i1.p1 TRINITY_DN9160_c0_g2~~TRINITY_DN9160_c0_g2_i1.p1  ORF type:complete len:105 (-),score=2.52 TRINITY_DN9160_c0_g2_i1:82-396(-)
MVATQRTPEWTIGLLVWKEGAGEEPCDCLTMSEPNKKTHCHTVAPIRGFYCCYESLNSDAPGSSSSDKAPWWSVPIPLSGPSGPASASASLIPSLGEICSDSGC